MYKVVRYFDDYLVEVVASNLTLEEAKRRVNELSSKNYAPYTSYDIQKEG